MYTGVVKSQTKATIPGEGLQESQCLAWSDDPMLEHWTKQPAADPAAAAGGDDGNRISRPFGLEAKRLVLHDGRFGSSRRSEDVSCCIGRRT